MDADVCALHFQKCKHVFLLRMIPLFINERFSLLLSLCYLSLSLYYCSPSSFMERSRAPANTQFAGWTVDSPGTEKSETCPDGRRAWTWRRCRRPAGTDKNKSGNIHRTHMLSIIRCLERKMREWADGLSWLSQQRAHRNRSSEESGVRHTTQYAVSPPWMKPVRTSVGWWR